MSVVNLNKARKARAKQTKKARADENAVKFGRTKAERAQEVAESTKSAARLDAHRRDKDD